MKKKSILMIKSLQKPADHLAEMLHDGFVSLGTHIDVYDPSGATNLDDYDAVIATSLRWDIIDIVSMAQKNAPERLYFIDGEDDPFIRSIYKYARLYFKREKLLNPTMANNLARPYGYIRHAAWVTIGNKKKEHLLKLLKNKEICGLSLQSRRQDIRSISLTTTIKKSEPYSKKRYDVCFFATGGKSNPFRARFAKLLTDYCLIHGYKAYVNLSKRLPYEQYTQIIRQSRVALSLRGLGWDTVRYWDIPSLGTCLFSEYLPIEIKNNFVEGKEAVFFKDFGDFAKKFEWVLNDNWQSIARNGKRKFEHYHTPGHRAEYLLNSINE